MSAVTDPVTVDDFEALAREKLTPMAYDYYRSGADDEETLAKNRAAFRRYEIWYRTLVDVREPRTKTSVLGRDVAFPILIAPTAYHALAHADAESATARAAAEVGSLYCASTLATTTLEDVAAAAPEAPRWFQLYVHRDRDFTRELVARAKAARYDAIAVTADTPVLGRRCADVRNGFALPQGMVMANLISALPPDLREGSGSELARFVASRHDPSFVFRDLEWLAQSAHPLPVVVKGICRPDDAKRALDHGARAIWVSNHGGRQLDHAPSTLDCLRAVVAALPRSIEVYVDGGVRSGTHAFIALALGAHAVFVGRPILWGLAAFGQPGVARVLSRLHEELVRTMRLAGCPNLESARDDVVRAVSV